MLTLVLVAIMMLLLVVLAVAALQIENWDRDLTTNVAETADDAEDPLLRPQRIDRSVAETANLAEHAGLSLNRWELASREIDSGAEVLHFVRTTALFRFKDDVTVRVEASNGGSRVTAVSRSRIGKGDLGQNPRNLREFFESLRTVERMKQPAETGS